MSMVVLEAPMTWIPQLYTILKDVLKKGGFTVHKFLTNDPALRIKVADDVVLNQSDASIVNSCDDGTKILGIPCRRVPIH